MNRHARAAAGVFFVGGVVLLLFDEPMRSLSWALICLGLFAVGVARDPRAPRRSPEVVAWLPAVALVAIVGAAGLEATTGPSARIGILLLLSLGTAAAFLHAGATATVEAGLVGRTLGAELVRGSAGWALIALAGTLAWRLNPTAPSLRSAGVIVALAGCAGLCAAILRRRGGRSPASL